MAKIKMRREDLSHGDLHLTRKRASSWLRVIVICGVVYASSQAAAAPCEMFWDGAALGKMARSRPMDQTIRLLDSSRATRGTVSARQVLAFTEATEAIAQQAGRGFRFIVCSDEKPNAFAKRQGGSDMIGATVGMIRLVDGDRDAAAMVVGHEVAHHDRNHLASSRNRDALLNILGAVIGAGLDAKLQTRGVASGVGMDVANLGSAMIARKFDRDQEREADAVGFDYLLRAGFAPAGAVRLAQNMAGRSDAAGLFLDSHPGWRERADNIQRMIGISEAAKALIARVGDFSLFTSPRDLGPALVLMTPAHTTTVEERKLGNAMEALRNDELVSALTQLKVSANSGNSKSQVSLAYVYLLGTRGAERNEADAIRFFQLAAAQGEPEAFFNLGLAAARGTGGVNKNAENAVNLYKRAAELGSGAAAQILGDAYLTGTPPLPKDPIEACRFFAKAEELGYAEGIASVGLCYEFGVGSWTKDVSKAYAQYRLASEKGVAMGTYRKALLTLRVPDSVPKDGVTADVLIREAANQGHAPARIHMGILSLNKLTRGGDTDAFRWFRSASDGGSAEGHVRLALMYAQGGLWLDKDEQEAARLFRLAADQGNAEGSFGLATILEATSFGEAVEHYRRAAAQGHKRSAERLRVLSNP